MDSGAVTEEIPPALDGERLDRVVSLITGISRTGAQDLVARGRVTVNGRVPSERVLRLVTGDEVTVELPEIVAESPPVANPTIGLDVVHEDDHILVLDKPPGLVVHPAPGHLDDTVVNGLLARNPEVVSVGEPRRPGIVHRLDRDTSGLMTVALDDDAYSGLVEALREHRVERVYRALVHGIPASARGVVDAPIGRSRRNRMRMAVSTEGRPARTHYEVERTFEGPVPISLLRCRLETGRTHQIRVHLTAIGHPVLGDQTYGRRTSMRAPRQMLHASRLGLEHPVTGERLEFRSPIPADMAGIMARLGGAEA